MRDIGSSSGTTPFTTLKDTWREALRRLSDRSMQSTEIDAERSEKVVENFIAIHHAKSRPRWRKEQERLLTKHFLSKHKDVALNRSSTKD